MFWQQQSSALAVERAINELQRGFPVAITNEFIFLPTQHATTELLHNMAELGEVKLYLTANRATYLLDRKVSVAVTLDARQYSLAQLQDIALTCPIPAIDDLSSIQPCDEQLAASAYSLGQAAELIPSFLYVSNPKAMPKELLQIEPEAIKKYIEQSTQELTEFSRGPLIMDGAEGKLITYRSSFGGKEHLAIIVGKPDMSNPLVRLHSSCFTGDILRSIKCDCRDQLHTAIKIMSKKHEGGIIVYLNQEGRGIGLANKMITYKLQALGLDTVEANEMLGFQDDLRAFNPAAAILERLGIKRLRLLSNNPRKSQGLINLGFEVSEVVPHAMPRHEHIDKYYDTKIAKLGHLMD
jgi:GTP cyclohydrolase II